MKFRGDAAEAAVAAQSHGCWPRRRHRYRACPADRASRSGRFAPITDPRLGGCAPGSQSTSEARQSCSTAAELLSRQRCRAVHWEEHRNRYAAPVRTAPLRTVALNGGRTVSAILLATDQIVAGYVLAPGAGAGMTHSFLSAVPEGLATRGIATLRYQFPYMEKGSRHPDRPARACAAGPFTIAWSMRSRIPRLSSSSDRQTFGCASTPACRKQRPCG